MKLFSSKESITVPTLEYVVILQNTGVPIYSKCWGNFCAVLTVDDTILTGFISAIASMPKMMNQQLDITAIEMGFTKLLFNYTSPTGYIICAGFRKEEINELSMVRINKFFKQVSDLLEVDYHDTQWNKLSDDDKKDFESYLLNSVIEPQFQTIQSDYHTNDDCSFSTSSPTYKDLNNIGLSVPFAVRISNIYRDLKDKLNKDPAFAEKKEQALKINEEVNGRANIKN